MRSIYKLRNIFFLGISCIFQWGCSKLVQVPEPVNSITTAETFSSNATATSAIMGIYNDMVTGGAGGGYQLSYSNGLISIDAGMSADELHMFNGPSPFEINSLNVSNIDGYDFWDHPYFDIYLANAAISTLPGSSGVSATTKNQLIGEAEFLRAFCYFYMVNLFGDVPLALTTAYAHTDTLSRTPASQVYAQMIADLQDAIKRLPNDYSISGGQRIRVNQPGARALLARVYLYQQKWQEAEMEADSVINNSLYSLDSLNGVFLVNSPEAILQWQLQSNDYPYATIEGNTLVPPPPSNVDAPTYYLTDTLLGSFEAGDERRYDWVDSTIYYGMTYYFPYKYKVYAGTAGNITEYPVVLRLAEQYLIRAEARAEQSNLNGAISDVDTIRTRAGLADLPTSLSQTQVLAAIMQERRIELMAEWGNRWLDLKRTGVAITVLSSDKGFTVSSDALLYPIPSSELLDDANLVQNPGY
jgi:hypothetical protein